MSKQKFPRNKLALALASALVGSTTVSTSAQAVGLANNLRLGDAAIFPYYTALGDWQTFFRLINTSEDAIVVKVRYREAANSREVLDFEVALSPYDMWSGWTDANATGNGLPGIRTNDTSCLFPLPDTANPRNEGFVTLDRDTNLVGADFKDRAFTQAYDDGAGLDPVDRMSEGHFEVIGVSRHPCRGPLATPKSSDFCQNVTHDARDGKPDSCQVAFNAFRATTADPNPLDPKNVSGAIDMGDVLAANAYLINVPSGQGAGYDPDMLAGCTNQSLAAETNGTDTNPDLDSCTALDMGVGPAENALSIGPVAWNQRDSDGTDPPSSTTTFLQADVNNSGGLTPYADQLNIDLNGDAICNGSELDIAEDNVPQAVYDAVKFDADPAAGDSKLLLVSQPLPGPGNCNYLIVETGGDQDTPFRTSIRQVSTPGVARIKQKGQLQLVTTPEFPYNQFAVTGGVDGVSRLFMRTSVINEWAASYNPDNLVSDYFTQWVLTFPTKHYYVDLQTDTNLSDDISPTLVDTDADDDAFAPFTFEFKGDSCESYEMDLWNREERHVQFTSPGPSEIPALCYETNVLTFNQRYVDEGLASNFTVTIPDINLPTDYDGKTSERGWGELVFTGPGAAVGLSNTNGLANPSSVYNYFGLPVTGFLFSVYYTGDSANNHNAINAHKYTESSVFCPGQPPGVCVTP